MSLTCIIFKVIIQRTDWRLLEVGVGLDKTAEGGNKVQTSGYNIKKSWGYNVQYGDCS